MAPGVGAELRAARLRLGRSLADMAAGLRIKPAYLDALEEGRVADLPGLAYAAGFLRTYASALGLDSDALARRFRAEVQEAEVQRVDRRSELAFPAPMPERGVPVGAAVLLGVLLAAGGYAAWYRSSGDAHSPAMPVPPVPERLASLAPGVPPSAPSPHVASLLPPAEPAPPRPAPERTAPVQTRSDEPSRAVHPAAEALEALPAATSPAPAAAPPPAPPRSVVGQAQAAPAEAPPEGRSEGRPEGRIVLRAKADAWVQVRERQGPTLLSRLLRAGETWPVPAGQSLVLTTGNAAGTEVLVDGEVVAPLGGSGAVRRDVPLDPEALKGNDPAKSETSKPGQTAPQSTAGPNTAGPNTTGPSAGQPGARAAASASTSRPPAQ